MTPHDWETPDWANATRVHDWKNYISDKLAGMWGGFTPEQKQAIAESADIAASYEEWE